VRKVLWSFLLLAGCATHGVHPLRPLDVATAPYAEGAAVDEVSGSLTYDDHCLGFRELDGQRLLPIWPRDSVFNGTSLMFHRPGKAEQPLLINQEIAIRGEPLPAAYVQANFAPYARRCGGVPFFVAEVAPAD